MGGGEGGTHILLRFETREAVADRLAEEGLPAEVVEKARAGARSDPILTTDCCCRRRPGPRSAMIKLGELGYQSEEGGGSSGEEDDPESILRLPNGMRYRWAGCRWPRVISAPGRAA